VTAEWFSHHDKSVVMIDPTDSKKICIFVNGKSTEANPKMHSSLLAFLRTELQMTGSKAGCATGNCGACNVLLDGHVRQSCQVSLTSIENSTVETIESIVQTSLAKRITNTLIKNDAAQCGYCLPGIVIATYSEMLTAETPDAVHALQGNLCRCGTNYRILNALKEVMKTGDCSSEDRSAGTNRHD